MSADLDEFRPPIIKTQPIDAGECGQIGDEDCDDTPKTPKHKIPAMLTCPPAPRKPTRRRVGSTCKRKRRVLEFFEIVARDEIESFFRMAEEEINGGANKKRCV